MATHLNHRGNESVTELKRCVATANAMRWDASRESRETWLILRLKSWKKRNRRRVHRAQSLVVVVVVTITITTTTTTTTILLSSSL